MKNPRLKRFAYLCATARRVFERTATGVLVGLIILLVARGCASTSSRHSDDGAEVARDVATDVATDVAAD